MDGYLNKLTLAALYLREASTQTRVSTGRDGQSYQVSPTHLDPLLRVGGADCGLQHHQQHHQALSSRHSGVCRCSSAGESKASLGSALGCRVGPVVGFIVPSQGLLLRLSGQSLNADGVLY